SRVDCKRDMHVRRAERVFPVGGGVIADIVEDRGPRRHALAELFGEALERRLRHSQGLEALMGERDAQPTRKTRLPPSVRRCYMREKTAQHLAPLRGVVDAKNDVLAGGRTRAWPKYRCLYVAQVESRGVRHRPADFNLRVHCVPPVRASCLTAFKGVVSRGYVDSRSDAPTRRGPGDEVFHGESR